MIDWIPVQGVPCLFPITAGIGSSFHLTLNLKRHKENGNFTTQLVSCFLFNLLNLEFCRFLFGFWMSGLFCVTSLVKLRFLPLTHEQTRILPSFWQGFSHLTAGERLMLKSDLEFGWCVFLSCVRCSVCYTLRFLRRTEDVFVLLVETELCIRRALALTRAWLCICNY